MRRWNIPWDYCEEHWTGSQMVCLTAAVIENAKEEARGSKDGGRKRSMRQFTDAQNAKA